VHTASNSTVAVIVVFGECLCSSPSPDLMPCNTYLWASLKDKVFKRNPHTLHDLEENIQKKYPGFPIRAATCEPKCVLMLQHMFMNTRQTFSAPPLYQ
jgi:hypothetical protein